MKDNQLTDIERKTYEWLVNQTKPMLKRYQRNIAILSIVVFLIILGAIVLYWTRPTVAHVTSLSIGGQLSSFFGALFLALRAFSNPFMLAQMSMTRLDGNSKLFAELMKSRLSAKVGLYFVVGGFAVQAAVKLVFGS